MKLTEYLAKESDIELIDSIRKIHYPKDVLVPIKLYSLLVSRQIGSTFILKSQDKVIGYYSIVFLEEIIYKKMMKHLITEKELGHIEYITEIKDTEGYNNKYLYILSIVAVDLKDAKSNLALLHNLKSKISNLTTNYRIKGVFTDFFNLKLKKIFENDTTLVKIENVSNLL